MHTSPAPIQGFEVTGLSSGLLLAVQRAGLRTPTPIQARTIPVALTGRDVIGIAQTGTGKTMAFALPIINHILQAPHKKALVIAPTRELALQIEESIRSLTRHLTGKALRTACVIGGTSMGRQIQELRQHPSVILATPGRLRDHLDQKTVSLNDISILVLDEADRMLDMGFAPQIKYIVAALPAQRQTMLFSATMAPEIATLAHTYLHNPERIEIARAGSSNAQIKQELCYVSREEKVDVLGELLNQHSGTVLVFSRTKHGATKLMKKVKTMGHSAAEIHSNRSLSQRRQALDGFKAGRYRVLIATDVASRGIDVTGISLVINYDLPEVAEDYVHRIGRTGRADHHGLAISLATPDQQKEVRAIEKLLNHPLPLSEHSAIRPVQAPPAFRTDSPRHRSPDPSRNKQTGRRQPFRPTRKPSYSNFNSRSQPGRKESGQSHLTPQFSNSI